MANFRFDAKFSDQVETLFSTKKLGIITDVCRGGSNKAIAQEHKVSNKAIEKTLTELNKIFDVQSKFHSARVRLLISMIALDLVDYSAAQAPSPVSNLNESLVRTLFLVCAGLSNHTIAELLKISEKTVEQRLSQLFDYMGIETKSQELENPRVLLMISAYLKGNITKALIKKLHKETKLPRLERILSEPSHFISELDKPNRMIG
jgi:DNA-binding NarL/FixJ family response regulator